MRFQWDENKARANVRKHDIRFEEALRVFADPDHSERLDDRKEFAEERWVAIRRPNRTSFRLLFVVYVDREFDVRRIISARTATPEEADDYYSR